VGGAWRPTALKDRRCGAEASAGFDRCVARRPRLPGTRSSTGRSLLLGLPVLPPGGGGVAAAAFQKAVVPASPPGAPLRYLRPHTPPPTLSLPVTPIVSHLRTAPPLPRRADAAPVAACLGALGASLSLGLLRRAVEAATPSKPAPRTPPLGHVVTKAGSYKYGAMVGRKRSYTEALLAAACAAVAGATADDANASGRPSRPRRSTRLGAVASIGAPRAATGAVAGDAGGVAVIGDADVDGVAASRDTIGQRHGLVRDHGRLASIHGRRSARLQRACRGATASGDGDGDGGRDGGINCGGDDDGDVRGNAAASCVPGAAVVGRRGHGGGLGSGRADVVAREPAATRGPSANTDVRYDMTMAHGLGRLRKDVSATFGRDAEWDGTPALGVIEFLSRFVKAGNDNDVSEGRALYLLPEFTKGDLKREL